MNYFPVFFDLKDQSVLVVGAGEVAARKISLLERTGAIITVVAPKVGAEVAQRAAAGTLRLRQRGFDPADLDGARLAIVATADRSLNHWIAGLSEARSIPVNVVDDRDVSRFIVPAIVDRDPILVAISTGGTSPVLARRLRERLEAALPKRLGPFARWLRELRDQAAQVLHDTGARRRFFEALIDGPAGRRYLAGDGTGAARIAAELLTAAAARPPQGEVTLVGAGPGDPELLTLKGLRALQDADVILHDRLVAPALLDLARRDATRICVGKSAGAASTSQECINALLVEHAAQGRRVVRLKGGDGFIFGRGGEELEALAAAGIAFSVVPGITAAIGCAAYAGIPLTHRDFSHGVSFVTAHADGNGIEPDWRALAAPRHTAVFYMGLARLEHIVRQLIEHGAEPDRPAAVVAQGTLPEQRVLTAPLSAILAAAEAASIASPALLIVGAAAALAHRLGWFDGAATALQDEPSQAAASAKSFSANQALLNNRD